MTKVKKSMAEAFAQLAPPVPTTVQDPVFINTKWGAVPIFGHHLISKKDLVILASCLNLPVFTQDSGQGISYHGTKVIVFRNDGEPTRNGKPIFGNATPACGGIAVNLLKIVSAGIEEAKNNPESCIRAGYHRNLILTLLHEIHHLTVLKELPKSKSLLATAEKEAEEWSYDMMMWLAQNVDIEPAHHSESSVLCGQIMELLKENNDDWSKSQRHMLDNNIFYALGETDEHAAMNFHNFKGYLHYISEDKTDDPKWNTQTIAGMGAESPLATTIRAVDTVTVKEEPAEVPQSATANNTPSASEFMEIEDPGYEGAMFVDPNMMGFGSFGAAPATSYGANPNPTTPLFTQQTPAPQFNPATPQFSQPQQQAPAPQFTPATPQYAVAGQTQAAVAVYPKTGLTPAQTGHVVVGVYYKIYNHIFGKCGRLLNSDLGFSNPEAVTEGIPLTEQEMQIIVKMDCLDANGRWCPNMPTSGGKLFGSIMKNAKLPTFKLYINEDGVEKVRMMLPQNTAKRDASGNYSKPALQARGGSCIMYIMEGNDMIAQSTGKKFLLKIVDGTIVAC